MDLSSDRSESRLAGNVIIRKRFSKVALFRSYRYRQPAPIAGSKIRLQRRAFILSNSRDLPTGQQSISIPSCATPYGNADHNHRPIRQPKARNYTLSKPALWPNSSNSAMLPGVQVFLSLWTRPRTRQIEQHWKDFVITVERFWLWRRVS